MKKKNATAQAVRDLADHAAALSGFSYTNCQACGLPSSGLTEFAPFVGLKPEIVERVIVDTGEKIKEKILAPHYGASIMLCYPCYRQAVQVDKRKLLAEGVKT